MARRLDDEDIAVRARSGGFDSVGVASGHYSDSSYAESVDAGDPTIDAVSASISYVRYYASFCDL